MALVSNGYGGINLPESAKQLDERLAAVEKAISAETADDATETTDVTALTAKIAANEEAVSTLVNEMTSLMDRVIKIETELAAISAAATTTSTTTATETAAKS